MPEHGVKKPIRRAGFLPCPTESLRRRRHTPLGDIRPVGLGNPTYASLFFMGLLPQRVGQVS